LALLGVLFALFVPAIAAARRAAARLQSQNNLKQIGLACHNYHDSFSLFPPGNDGNNFSAAAYLLPYLEQDNLFRQINFEKPMTDKVNETVRKTPVKVYLNPQDPQKAVTDQYGATNYLFSAGSLHALKENDGVFYHTSRLSLAAITDGTSNTIMTGETLKGDGGTKAVDVKRQHVLLKEDALRAITGDTGVKEFAENTNIAGDRCASWMDGRFLQGTFTSTREMDDKKPDVSCEGAGGLSALRSLEGTVNVGFCDGSVRSIRKAIKMDVWKALTTRGGGEVIPGDF
jgi:prepilin-type processing-associated H-X9-DG protein